MSEQAAKTSLSPPRSEDTERARCNDYYASADVQNKLWSDRWLEMFRHGRWCSGESPLMDPIEPTFDSYHPYACNGCKRGPFTNRVRLFRCSKCHVIRYCAREHQKADWPQHKRWCNAFRACRDHPLYVKSLKPANLSSWRTSSRSLSSLVIGRMGGAWLHTSTSQIVMMQPRCRKCFMSGAASANGVDGSSDMISCPRCHGVALCRSCADDAGISSGGTPDQHASFHVGGTEGGTAECDGHILALSCSGMVVEQGCPLTIESDTDCDVYFQPHDWVEYMQRKREDFCLPKHMMLMAPVVAFVTDGLSLPLTMQHALGHPAVLGKDKASSLSRLVIHLVGASAAEELGVSKFIELVRLMPALTYLRIVAIGPDLERTSESFPDEGRPLNFTDRLKSPIRGDCDARILRRVGYYHDVVASLQDEPTLVFASHSGMHDQTYKEHWRPTIELLSSKNIPCVFTGYNRKEAADDSEILTEDFGAKIIVPPTANPFRGLRPFLDPERSPSDFIYSNSYYVITQGSKA